MVKLFRSREIRITPVAEDTSVQRGWPALSVLIIQTVFAIPCAALGGEERGAGSPFLGRRHWPVLQKGLMM
jgi:hypothetical protein